MNKPREPRTKTPKEKISSVAVRKHLCASASLRLCVKKSHTANA
jgi:hypothetical protein